MEKLTAVKVTDLSTYASNNIIGDVISLLLLLLLLIVIVLAHFNKKSKIDLADLFLDTTGKIGGSQMRLNMAFILSSWAIVYTTLEGNLTEWLMGGYLAAFVVDRIYSRKADVAKEENEDDAVNRNVDKE
jgi:hypothetical protein